MCGRADGADGAIGWGARDTALCAWVGLMGMVGRDPASCAVRLMGLMGLMGLVGVVGTQPHVRVGLMRLIDGVVGLMGGGGGTPPRAGQAVDGVVGQGPRLVCRLG